jgi:maleylacetate reductase
LIVRWSLADLPGVLAELGVERPFLVASERWSVEVPVIGRWSEVPSDRIEVPPDADSLLAWGGGSTIDTAHAASAATGLPVVSVPTTYSGAEWTSGFGIRTPDRRMVSGGAGAHLAAIVYDVELTLDLPREPTVGTALNALAHCAEALYVRATAASDAVALRGAARIAQSLPAVVAAPHDRAARTVLLEGAANGGEALALAGLGLAHAMAQALGGRYGLPHGAMNALCLPPALRFNAPIVPDAVARFGSAIEAEDAPAERVQQLALLADIERLSQFGVPENELPEVAALAAARPGNAANPRPATPGEIEELLESIW